MQRHISFCSLLLLLLFVPQTALSAPAAGKVRSALGVVERQKIKKKDWNRLSTNMNVFQSDRVRTGLESQVVVGLTDGSLITIAENAEVELSSLLEETEKGAFRTRIDVKKGFINFAVEKQTPKSTFEFKTVTATAAIRGTNGFIGSDGETVYASLATGKLDVKLDKGGATVPITAGETIFGNENLVTLKLASSGKTKFAKEVRRILSSGEKDVEKLKKQIEDADASFQAEEANKSNAASFNITTASPVEVCNEGLTIEGTYVASNSGDALVISVGKEFTSENLMRVADGNEHPFSQKISISDANNLWNEKVAKVSMISDGVESSKVVDLHVNKSCQGVNKTPPSIKFLSYDSIGCKMNISVGNMQDDAGILVASKNGASIAEETLTRNEQKRFKLDPGVYTYEFTVTDQAQNKASFKKSLGCYPMKRFNIDVYGKAHETLKIPPPPKGMQDKIVKTLQFKVKNPENDPVFLHKVTVKQNGKVILQETLNQIQSLDYEVPVDLVRRAQNKFDIEVVHKSGFIAKAQKIFEVN